MVSERGWENVNKWLQKIWQKSKSSAVGRFIWKLNGSPSTRPCKLFTARLKLQLSIESRKDNMTGRIWDLSLGSGFWVCVCVCVCSGHVYAHMVAEIKTSWNCFSNIISAGGEISIFAGSIFPCVYGGDMNNIRRIRAIISNNILLLIAFDQTGEPTQPEKPPSRTIWLLQTHILCGP